ncbi:MAG: L-threonylcarbamoyladenylate synthase [Myxococcales bacterium]|nr:L-threonylcarbamoyladenylate synthase [Polyangiaceae bacterium]MDW8247783.1 L-threonylcarbamoyladenylate synthase [Myxococcales bacterium]
MARILAPTDEGIRQVTAALAGGELAAFPTETVYGLGALALNPAAVRTIFEVKGRPPSNPIIVHVLGLDEAAPLVTSIPPLAQHLANAFWPGPLTLVLPRSTIVPDEVTAGGPTVALRSPAHPVARALLAALGKPVAAPSANRSSEVSPTTAAHVQTALGNRIGLILDGGPCTIGIESTVLDITGEVPVVLRPGSISREAIEAVLKPSYSFPPFPPRLGEGGAEGGPLRSPGLLERHYAPRSIAVLALPEQIEAERARLSAHGLRVGVLGVSLSWGEGLLLPADPEGYARGLYAALHELDARFDALVIEAPGSGPAWEAVLDRLRRATARGDDKPEREAQGLLPQQG